MKRKTRIRSLKHLWPQLDIPAAEQAQVEIDLLVGIDLFRQDNSFAQFFSDAELIDRSVVLGIGAVEVVRDQTLALDTRLTVVRYTLGRMNPIADDGVPFGLPILISFIAGLGLLDLHVFRVLFQINHRERLWFDDWRITEILILLDWLIVKAEVSDDERTWWLFYFLVHCEQPDKGKAMFAFVINHPALPLASQRRLNDEILSDKLSTLTAPPQWRAMQAIWRGDRAAYEAARAELPNDEQLPFSPGDGTFDVSLEPEVESGPISFGFIRSLFLDDFMLTPAFLKRQAVSHLVKLGEDPLTVCQLYLGRHDYYTDAINAGVADVLVSQHAAIPDQATRELIDRALSTSAVITRKAFYRVGIDLFGAEYVARAQTDSANSIRQWATKLASGEASLSKRRGRKPKS